MNLDEYSWGRFLTTGFSGLELLGFFLSIIGTMALATILRSYYIANGQSLSNRRTLADSFVLLAVSVTLIIYLIKGSIALSLGLVGALSIVRFRAAIKEPEELVFLLFAIALGLGFGAGQYMYTVLAFFSVLPFLWLLQNFFFNPSKSQYTTLCYSIPLQGNSQDELLQKITDKFAYEKIQLKMRRLFMDAGVLEVTYNVHFKDTVALTRITKFLKELSQDAEISILDQNSW
jgi:uncharacterized membrane protein YhiD involved in acid resistance